MSESQIFKNITQIGQLANFCPFYKSWPKNKLFVTFKSGLKVAKSRQILTKIACFKIDFQIVKKIFCSFVKKF